MPDINVEWVDEVPELYRNTPYDEVAQRVRENGDVAKIATTESSLHTLAARLRNRFTDLEVTGRTRQDGWFVYIAQKEEGDS